MDVLIGRTFVATLLLALAGCALTQPDMPRRYLDSETAATITAGAQWLFARERPDVAVNVRDYLTLHPVDVNRSGDHRIYLVAHAWSTASTGERTFVAPPQLALAADDRVFALAAHSTEPRTLGIGEPIVRARGATASVWYYSVEREAFAYIATSRRVQAMLQLERLRAPYVPWRDPRPAAAAFLEFLAH